MFKPLTIKDIARVLNISPSTVSRALRNSEEINKETKKRILEYIESINYTRNPLALSLKKSVSYTIGIVISEVNNPFFSEVINGIESISYNKGYNVIISQTYNDKDREEENLKYLVNRSVDGIIISPSMEPENKSYISSLLKKKFPIVFVDRIPESIPAIKIAIDNHGTAFKATKHLLQKGCGNIAFISHSPHLYISKERERGYKDSLINHGINVNIEYVKYCENKNSSVEELKTIINDLLNLSKKTDGFILASDSVCMNFLIALKSFDFCQVPIVGFTNSNIVQLLSPRISNIKQPAYQMGEMAAQNLIEMIENKVHYPNGYMKILDSDIIDAE